MTLLQMQQLSRQPADYGAEILVQVINTNYYFGNLSNLGNYGNCVCWVNIAIWNCYYTTRTIMCSQQAGAPEC